MPPETHTPAAGYSFMQQLRPDSCHFKRMIDTCERNQAVAPAKPGDQSSSWDSAPQRGWHAITPIRSAEPRRWLVFVSAIVASVFVHEIGHCVVAWVFGCPAIPTPAKEYLLRPLPATAQSQVALGGMIGTVTVLVGVLVGMLRHPTPSRSAVLAGAITLPGFYTLRFLLAGRGHDATEFQEAQAAMGLSYSGHALDAMFLGLLVVVAILWFWRMRPRMTCRLGCRLAIGVLAALIVLVVLQSVNNMVFDPLFHN